MKYVCSKRDYSKIEVVYRVKPLLKEFSQFRLFKLFEVQNFNYILQFGINRQSPTSYPLLYVLIGHGD